MKKTTYKIMVYNKEKPTFECKMKKYFTPQSNSQMYHFLEEKEGYYNLGDNIYINKEGSSATYTFNMFGLKIPMHPILEQYFLSLEDIRTIKGCQKVKPYILKWFEEHKITRHLEDAKQRYTELGGLVDEEISN